MSDVFALFGSKADFRFGRLNPTIGLGNGIDSSSEAVDFFVLHLHNFDGGGSTPSKSVDQQEVGQI